MSYLIGVDGGGSKTTALVARPDGTILGRGSADCSNYRAVGPESACQAIDQALRAAFTGAGLTFDPAAVSMACFGLAGVDRPDDEAPVQAWAEQLWPGMPVRYVNDARLVLAAGTPEGWGLALICGTGSIAYGRTPQGAFTRAGGWGYLLGDEGSGYDIGRAALRRVARAADGRAPQTALTGLVLDHWSLEKPQDLIRFVYRPEIPRKEIAALAVLVEQAASQGDPAALEIVERAGDELAAAVRVVASRMDFRGPTPCALAGGVLVQGARVAGAFLASAARQGLALEPVQKVAEPAYGAVLLAREFLA